MRKSEILISKFETIPKSKIPITKTKGILNFIIDSFESVSDFEFRASSLFVLYMARQTIIGYFVLGMAVHAPSHRHVHPGRGGWSLGFSNIPVTGLTREFA